MTWQQFLPLRGFLKIVHHVPGRMRLRLDKRALVSSPAVPVGELQQALEELPGVRSLRISRATLSAILEYDRLLLPADKLEQLIQASEEHALAVIEELGGAAMTQGESA